MSENTPAAQPTYSDEQISKCRAALSEHAGNRVRAAKALGVSRGTVVNMLADPRLSDAPRAKRGRPAGPSLPKLPAVVA